MTGDLTEASVDGFILELISELLPEVDISKLGKKTQRYREIRDAMCRKLHDEGEREGGLTVLKQIVRCMDCQDGGINKRTGMVYCQRLALNTDGDTTQNAELVMGPRDFCSLAKLDMERETIE